MQGTPFCLPQTCCCSLLLGSETPLPSRLISPPVERFSRVQEPFLLHSSLPGAQTLSPFFLFLFPFVLPNYMEVFLSFWMPEVFCQHSVAVLCKSVPLVDVFSMFLWENVNSTSYSSAILIPLPSSEKFIFNLFLARLYNYHKL